MKVAISILLSVSLLARPLNFGQSYRSAVIFRLVVMFGLALGASLDEVGGGRGPGCESWSLNVEVQGHGIEYES
jgi:hypothetical protein